MHYLIEHETVLEYPETIREHHIELRLAPRSDKHQEVCSCIIETEPKGELSRYNDYFGNRVDYFCVIPQHKRLVTRLKSEVVTSQYNPFDFTEIPPSEEEKWLKEFIRFSPNFNDYLFHRSTVTPSAQKLTDVMNLSLPRFDVEKPILNNLLDLMGWIPTVLEYRTGSTEVHGELLTAMEIGAGVCQDFAHLFITVARYWGVPTRYVMGYLDPGISGETEALSTHAWAEALVPGAGWLGFDATHNLLANDHYVAVAVGRDSFDAAPQRGSFKGDGADTKPSVKVTLHEE